MACMFNSIGNKSAHVTGPSGVSPKRQKDKSEENQGRWLSGNTNGDACFSLD